MERTSRRNLLRAVAASGAAAAGIGVALRTGISSSAAAQESGHQHGIMNDGPSGNLANVTVSFGNWKIDPPWDRMTQPATPDRNVHNITPKRARVKAGGSVSFIIAGLHQVQVFQDGWQPGDINTSLTTPMTGPAPFTGLPLINDPNGRLYRGPDPSLVPQDRVEVVHFPHPGNYLVICGFLFHFQDLMFSHVKVT